MSKVAVIVPWRLTPKREASMFYASRHNDEIYKNYPLYKSDSTEPNFNRSQARNNGCLQAIKDGHEILVVLDADTIFQKQSINKAIELIEQGYNGAIHPFDKDQTIWFRQMETFEQEQDFLKNFLQNTKIPEIKHVGSGWIMSAETYKTLNGWDERFEQWGWEDNALEKAHQIIYGYGIKHIDGYAFRLAHETEEEPKDQNEQYYERTYDKITNKSEMLSLLCRNRL